jgi:hypothetical protein
LEVFRGDLQTLWQSSQPRRRKACSRNGKRTRPDPFEAGVALIEDWLRAEPMLSSRLMALRPERYNKSQRRTLRRRLRAHRLRRIEEEMAAAQSNEGGLDAPGAVG